MVAKNEKNDKCFCFDVLTPNDLLHLKKNKFGGWSSRKQKEKD